MILNYLDELKLYLDKKELTPPDKEARKEIVNNIEDEIKNLLSRIDGLNEVRISRSYKSGLNLFLRIPNTTLHITLNFNDKTLKLNLSSPLHTGMLFPDMNWIMNNKLLEKVDSLFKNVVDSQGIFYETSFELDENYENNLLLSFINIVDYLEHSLEEIAQFSSNLNFNEIFYFDMDRNLLVGNNEFENLFNPSEQNINYSKENDKLFLKLKEHPFDNNLKLTIAHLNMPLALKYIYPHKNHLTENELSEMYTAAIDAFLVCIDKYEPKASFAYYVSNRLFSNISRCKSKIIRKRIFKNYKTQPTFSEIDNFIKNFKVENNNQYPSIDDTVGHFTPIIENRIKEKNLKEQIKYENKYLKSAIPTLYHLVTGREIKYEDKDIHTMFVADLDKCINYVLGEKENFIIRNRYLSNFDRTNNSSIRTLEEVANQLSLTRERVRQIEKKALLKLESIWKYIIPFDKEKFEGLSSNFFDSISPTYSHRSKEVKKLIIELEQKGYLYKGLLSSKIDLVLETGKNLKIDNLALKKYVNFLSTDPIAGQQFSFQAPQNQISLDTKLINLEFSVRANNVFRENQIFTLRDLTSHSKEDLMLMTNFGKTTLYEVNKKLEEHQLKLSQVSIVSGNANSSIKMIN